MRPLAIEPNARGGHDVLGLSGDASSIAIRNRDKPELTEASQSRLSPNHPVFETSKRQPFLKSPSRVARQTSADRRTREKRFPERPRSFKELDSQLLQLRFFFSKNNGTAALTQSSLVCFQNDLASPFRSDAQYLEIASDLDARREPSQIVRVWQRPRFVKIVD